MNMKAIRFQPAEPSAARKLAPLDMSSDKCFEALNATEQELTQARDYAQAIVETAPPLLVLDADLRVKTANESFYKHFRVSPPQTENCLVYELGNGQWNIPKLRTFLDEVLPRHSFFNDFEVMHEFETIGRRTVLLSGRQVDHLQRILLFIDDITERRESQAAMRTSEIRYRRLFEAARDGILILDPDTRKITDANPFMSELLGYPHDELLGRELWEIGLLKDEDASRAAFRQLQKKHFIRYEDLPLQTKAGRRHEVEFVSNLYEEDGRKVIQCNIRDITERKEVEDRVRSSEIRYRRLFEAAHDGILILDPIHRTITDANPFMTTLLGYTRTELLGKELWEIGLLKDEAASQAAFLELQEKGYIRYEDLPLKTKAGERREVEFVSNVYIENSATVIQCNIRDITERKRAEQSLADAHAEISRHADQLEKTVSERTDQLREKIGELEAFSYTLSHDMRAPLRAMRGYARMLLEEHSAKLNTEGIHHLERINAAAGLMSSLVDDVLNYARVLRSDISMEAVDLDKLVRQIIETYPQLQTGEAEIHIDGGLPKAWGNQASLWQCLSNLLTNAIKFVAAGTKPRVKVRAEDIGADIRLWVEDNGIGIAPKDRERIFRMFERVSPATDYEGTGMGLAIVRKAAERMGGSAGVESVVGQGSKFWIQLRKGANA
jgi:PAS domain S-box-containing protein